MLQVRKAQDRGHFNHGWLDTYHTFSFGNYYDEQFIGFSDLRVINEDWIAAGQGFGMHPHKNMEILTYVLSGTVAHQDSMGNAQQVNAGEFQIMSAGSGIRHAEINPHDEQPLHLYQIWILPNQLGITPRYQTKRFADQQGATLILSPEGEQGAFKVYQDMYLWRYQCSQAQPFELPLSGKRRYWLQLVKGEMLLAQQLLRAGDGVAVSQEQALSVCVQTEVEFLLFDLA